MNQIVETARLLIREFVEGDAEAFFEFNGDPRVMRHTGEEPSSSVEQVREGIREYPDYRKHGYGRWAVVYKPEDRIVGFNGLKYLDDLGEVDLGYRIAFDYWGRGIATESSLAVVRYGFETLDLRRIIGLVLPENAGSIRVLEKVGMCRDGTITYYGQRAQRWSLTREAWWRNAGGGEKRLGVTLRDVLDSDLAVLFAQQCDAEACRLAAFAPRDEKTFMAHWKGKILPEPTVQKKAIVVDGNVAGNIVCFGQPGEREIGYWIGREHWGKGVATAALNQFLRFVTERPLFAIVAKHNVASIRVLEKCGFTWKGSRRRTKGARGPAVDEVVLQLTTRSVPPACTAGG